MRNSTKLRNLLIRYTVTWDMDDGATYRLTLMDKVDHSTVQFEGTSYSALLGKAHSYMLRMIKKAGGVND
jgi:hypothetical protein